MIELFDAIYIDPKDNDSTKRGLINELGDAAADYCFDEAWLDWLARKKMLVGQFSEIQKTLYSKTGKRTSLAVACAASEIGERLYKPEGNHGLQQIRENPQAYYGYASDGGSVQRSMYIRLAQYNDGISIKDGYKSPLGIDYCKDALTNFYYVIKTALYFLDPDIYRSPSSESQFGSSGPREYRKWNCFSETYSKLAGEIENSMSYVAEPIRRKFRKELNDFAHNSACLGNFGCVPKVLKRVEAENGFCNTAKSGGMYVPIIINDEKKLLNVNDQMALFAEWIDLYATKSEVRRVVGPWKETMMLGGLVWDYYKDAALAYKSAFSSRVLESRIAQFAEYLRCVNRAIELRSKIIVDKIETETSEKTKEPHPTIGQ